MNASTSTVIQVGATHADPITACAAAAAALYGPRHGGACESALRMFATIGSVDAVPAYLERVKAGEVRLAGFGHRVYKAYDPRARLVKKIADRVFAVTGENELVRVARALERAALEDEYFVKRRLFTNVDFYTGLIYSQLGLPPDFFPVMFAIPRVVGWLAHYKESIVEQRAPLFRPRQVYVGHAVRPFVRPTNDDDVEDANDALTTTKKKKKQPIVLSAISVSGGRLVSRL